jgi:hypothetical protein
MEMENKNLILVGLQNQAVFNEILQSMFPEQDYSEDGRHIGKAKITFERMVEDKWTVEQFEETMKKFFYTHKSTFWMPHDIFVIKDRIFPEPEITL